jgi:hypothetical protein
MEKTRKIQSIIQDVIEGRKDNNEATIDILALCDVSQQRELLIGALEEYNNVKYEWSKLTYEDYVNKYHPNL